MFNFLARNNKKWEILKKARMQEVCFQNGSLPLKTGDLEHSSYIKKDL